MHEENIFWFEKKNYKFKPFSRLLAQSWRCVGTCRILMYPNATSGKTYLILFNATA